MNKPRKFTLAIGVFRRDKYVLMADGKAVIQIADSEAAAIREMVAPGLLEAAKELLEAVAICTPDAPDPVPGSVIDKARKAILATEAVKP